MTKYPPTMQDEIRIAKGMGKHAWEKIFPATNTGPVNCSNCNDTGFIGLAVEIQGPFVAFPSFTGPEKCVETIGDQYYLCKHTVHPCHICSSHQRRVEFIMGDSGLESWEHKLSLDYLQNKPGKQVGYQTALQILGMAPNPLGIYIFYGEHGRGKSGILKALVAGLAKAGIPARYVRAEEILQEIRSTYKQDTDIHEDEILRKYDSYRLLAIDELDQDRVSGSQWALAQLFVLLDKRYNKRQRMCTVLASNRRPEGLWSYLTSRLYHAEQVEMEGPDLRQSETDQNIYMGSD